MSGSPSFPVIPTPDARLLFCKLLIAGIRISERIGFIDGLVQESRNSIANALELRLSRT